MTKPRKTRHATLLAAALVLLTAGSMGATLTGASARPAVFVQTQEAIDLEGVTAPSKDVDLAFSDLGKILTVNVVEGDLVEQGDVLMVQDDRADRERLRALEAEADVAARIELARQRRDLAGVQLTRLEDLRQRGGGSQSELEEAQLNKAIAETQILEEQRQGLVAEARAAEARVLIEQRSLASPVSGVVRRVDAAVGEVYGPQTPALRLVTIDPLRVEVILAPPSVVSQLKLGQTVQVRYEQDEEWREAKVTFIDPVADLSTSNQTFHLEVPNPELRPAGLPVQVRLPAGAEGGLVETGAENSTAVPA